MQQDRRAAGLSVAAQLADRVRSIANFSVPGPHGTVQYHVCELDQRVVVRVELPESGDLIARFTTFVEEPAGEADDAWKADAPDPLVSEGRDSAGRLAVVRHYSTGLLPEMLNLDVGGKTADFRGPDEGLGDVSLWDSDLFAAPDNSESILADLDAQLREAVGLWPRPWPEPSTETRPTQELSRHAASRGDAEEM